VAGYTTQITVNRITEALLVDPQRDRFAISFRDKSTVAMTGEAFIVILGAQLNRAQNRKEQRGQHKSRERMEYLPSGEISPDGILSSIMPHCGLIRDHFSSVVILVRHSRQRKSMCCVPKLSGNS